VLPRIRYAFRSLSKAPLLSLVVVSSLALGIGANTAIFSALNQMLLAKLPVPHPERLSLLTNPGAPKNGSSSTNSSGGMEYIFSYRAFREMARQAQPAALLGAFCGTGANVAYGGETAPARVLQVSGGYFAALGVTPALGRLIQPEDDTEGGGNPVALVSHNYWRDRMGSQASALNQPIRVSGRAFTIVGVTPQGFTGTTMGNSPDVFVPLAAHATLAPGFKPERYDYYWVYLLARTRPGYTRQQAEGALNAIYRGIAEQQAAGLSAAQAKDAERLRKSNLKLEDGSHGNSFMRQGSRTPLLILMAATGMVLLIAMANAANLLLARAMERRRELAIRAALGAGRAEIAGQLLVEALILAGGGAVAGLAFSVVTLKLIISQLPSDANMPPDFLSAQLQWPVLLYALGISLVTGLAFGLYPAFEAARSAPASALNEESGRASSTRGASIVRRGLVCAQVMISAILLIPTGLFLKSLVNLTHVEIGVRTENLVTFGIEPERNGYTHEQCRTLIGRAEAALAAIPGVSSVSAAMVPLIGGSNWNNTLTVEGFASGPGIDSNSSLNNVSPGYFANLGVPLLYGREFTEADNLAAPRIAVVNEQFAKYFFGDKNPLGRRFGMGWGNKVKLDHEIVGVVKDTHYANVRQKPPRLYYTPWRQDKEPGGMSFYLRSSLPPAQVIAQARRVMRGLDPNLPPRDLRTMDEQIRHDIQSDRLVLMLAAVFAVLATVLAMLGLYGVMAHSVARRTREIGIRMALGAQPGRIRAMVLREMLLILSLGLLVGVPAALALSRYTESQLFGVKAGDPIVIVAAIVALAAAASAVGYIPALHASRVDPQTALRHD
jgi:putative ABC transport system permease protein